MAVGEAIGAGVGIIVSTIGKVKSAKEQARLQEKIAKLTLAQQERIAETMAKAQTEIERQKILFQAVALELNNSTLEEIQRDKTKSIMYLSIGLTILGMVVIFVKKKKV